VIDLKQINIKSNLGLPIGVLCLLAMIVLPLPPYILDFFFTLNIVIALLIMAKAINVDRPLAFTTFPAIILIATLLRLAMNVASTRVILLEGHKGSEAAGSVISAFGDFVIGGQYAVGLIVFLILVLVNFLVITKGTGRVSEVSARFKLDALPGKQMAIDADLNAGSLTPEEATAKREELTSEADFYGAMDGASKFVKGDAIAGIVILFINIVGGLTLGVASHGMTFSAAAETYILLTIGDGIVAQIPGLILSVATGVIITRAGKKQSLGEQIKGEFLTSGKNFYMAGMVLFVLGIIPGMPNVAFLVFAFMIAGMGFYIDTASRKSLVEVNELVVEEVQGTNAEVTWDDIKHVKPLEVHVGFGLAGWIQKDENEIVNRLKGLRRKLSQELGFLVSAISVQDDIDLPGYEYVIKLHGEDLSRFEIQPQKLLAVGESVKKMHGIRVKEPAFGMESMWIKDVDKGMAEVYGAQVFEPERVLTTHLAEVIKKNAYSLFGYDEAKKLLDKAGETSPHLVEEYNSKVKGVETLVKVMKILLKEKVPLRDVKNIIRVIVESYNENMPVIFLAQAVRNALGRSILNSIFKSGDVQLIAMESALQQMLINNVVNNGVESVAIEPNMANSMAEQLEALVPERMSQGLPSVLAVDEHIRYQIENTLGSRIPNLYVIAVQEIPDGVDFEIVMTLET